MANQTDTLPMSAEPNPAAGPWGFWATLGWTLLAFTVGLLVAGVVVTGLVRWDTSLSDYEFLFRNGNPIGSSVMLLSYGVLITVLVFAARCSGSSAAEYLGFVRPRGRYVLAGLLCMVFPLLLTFAHAMQFDASQFLNAHGFDRARAANGLIIHVMAVVVIGPVMEEIVFRGFLYRGLSATRIGIAGTVVITALVWALMHAGKGPAGIFDTAIHGIAWGWLRWYTGSIWIPIASHVATNGFAVLLILLGLYGWFG
jgi:membrane protease YdiL (CAAX protease family)